MNDKNTYLHLLEKKLNSFKKRLPLYCQTLVLYDEDSVLISLPDHKEETIRLEVNFSLDINENIRKIYEILFSYFPALESKGRTFKIDKVDFRSNSFVVKRSLDDSWSAIYHMKRPVSLLLKELNNSSLSSVRKEQIFRENIRENTSREDYRAIF